MAKQRTNIMASPEFRRKLLLLQGRIQATTGEKVSFRELTNQIAKAEAFQEVENQLLKNDIKKLNINFNVDGRIK
jgi:hypothetical protein